MSELGEIGEGLAAKLPEGDYNTWIQKLLSGSAVPPVIVYSYGHYVTLVKESRVTVEHYNLVSGFYPGQEERCFQHFRVRVERVDELVSIIHCHAPSSQKRSLSANGRMHYVRALHRTSNGDPFIWGGDFNTGPFQLTSLMKNIDCRYASRQLFYSNPISFKHGDVAVTYGLCAVQENSKVGKSHNGASDTHDLVIAKVFGTGGSGPGRPYTHPRQGQGSDPPPGRQSRQVEVQIDMSGLTSGGGL